MFILVIGNPMDGLAFEGLFTTTQDAVKYGEKEYSNTEWWVAPLTLNSPHYDEYLDIISGSPKPPTNDF
jgi:hypothetical protein